MSNSTVAREAARQRDGKFGAQHRDAVDVPLDDQPTMTLHLDGTCVWRLNGEFHRLDGPAIELADGTRCWLVNGEYHRSDGPAIERTDGGQEFWVHGKRHRLDGPAVELADGTREFLVDGKRYATEADWRQAVEARTHTG